MARGFRDEDNERGGNDGVAFENVECLRSTAMAIQCVVNGKEVWIPQSVVHDDSEVFEVGHAGRLVVKEWFARKDLGHE